MSHGPYLLGLDLGTQSFRAAIIGLNGASIAFGVEPIETKYPGPAWAEQDPNQWWTAARNAVGKALSQGCIEPESIAAIGMDCTACTVVASTLDGRSLRPALLWMDQRSSQEADDLAATNDPILKYVSGRLSPEWMLPKALWLKRHEPETYAQADRLVECTDWLMHKLTGEWTLSLNHIAVKWNYSTRDGGLPLSMMNAVGLDDLVGKWPEQIVPLGVSTAGLSVSAAEHLGLKPGTPVAQSGIDAYLGMLGMGATNSGDVALIVGSSTCHLAQTPAGVFGSGVAGCYPDATIKGLYTVEAGQTATGSILDWYRRNFAGTEQAEADAKKVNIFELLDAKASQTPPGADGVLIREDWQGNRSPFKNPHARGAITGLTLSHGSGHVIRAIYEATAFGTRHILEDASKFGLEVSRIFMGGGGVKSELWCRIHADILGLPVHIPRESEACALGSAMSAAVSVGLVQNWDEAARKMVKIDRIVEPNSANRDLYASLFEKYVGLYAALND